MKSRRKFLKSSAAFATLGILGGCQRSGKIDPSQVPGENSVVSNWYMPEEGDPHECTWMSFGASQRVWGKKLIGEVRKNLATVAETIAQFEPVVMFIRKDETELIAEYFVDRTNIEFIECPLNDLWIRDFGAVYVLNGSGGKAAIDFNFNGWGEKQEFENDAQIAELMADESKVGLLKTEICLEGGGIEIDGDGTAIVTESCVINDNRNPDWTKEDCEGELGELLGLKKIIWLPGVRGADITDGHTDFYARFAKPGAVVAHLDPDKSSSEYELTRRHLEILESSTDARGNQLDVVTLEPPKTVRQRFDSDEFCAGYINFYVCNNAVIAPEFGDVETDSIAKSTLTDLFPDREVVMLNIDGIAAGGGGIHCATQQEPSA